LAGAEAGQKIPLIVAPAGGIPETNVMYGLHLSAEQIEIRDTVRDFVAEKIRPIATSSARLEPLAKPLLMDALDQASQLGLRALMLPEDAGGAGTDTLTGCIVVEELAAGDPDIASILAQTASLARRLFDHTITPQQRARFLPAFQSDDRYHLALAVHEPGGDDALGIHYHRPERSQAPIATKAARSGDSFIVNGRKERVANAPLAKLFAVEVETDSGAGTLLISRDAPGLAVTDSNRPGRWYHGASGEVTFENCRVPVDNLLSAPLRPDAASPLDQAINVGIGRAAYEAAIEYASLRVQGGRRIIEHQAIGTKLADCAIKLELARNMIWKAAWALDHPDAAASLPELPLHVMARVYTAEAVNEVVLLSAECFGAMGVMRDMPLQKYVHDSMIFLHSDDADGAAKLAVAEAIAEYQRPAAAA
jgi:alkylation response protein AidB-like acyl-CoA dehydrogenase